MNTRQEKCLGVRIYFQRFLGGLQSPFPVRIHIVLRSEQELRAVNMNTSSWIRKRRVGLFWTFWTSKIDSGRSDGFPFSKWKLWTSIGTHLRSSLYKMWKHNMAILVLKHPFESQVLFWISCFLTCERLPVAALMSTFESRAFRSLSVRPWPCTCLFVKLMRLDFWAFTPGRVHVLCWI